MIRLKNSTTRQASKNSPVHWERVENPVWTAAITIALCCLLFGKQTWMGFAEFQDRREIDRLNRLVREYESMVGSAPDLALVELYHCGLNERRLNPTPFGGYYRYDLRGGEVYNPNRAAGSP